MTPKMNINGPTIKSMKIPASGEAPKLIITKTSVASPIKKIDKLYKNLIIF